MGRTPGPIVVALVITGLAACGRDELKPGEARLVVDGRAQVAEADGPFRTARGTRRVRFGDRVRVVQGTARIELSDDRSLELRRRAAATVGQPIQLIRGDSLVRASGTRLSVRTATTDVIVTRGAARVHAALAVRAASYVGGLDVDSAGRRLHVPALRQAVVATPGLVPDRPLAISYEPADSWDRRYLGDAIDLGAELATRSRGFAAQTAPAGSPATFYRQLLPQLATESTFVDGTVDPARSSGETLVGAAIVVQSRRGTFGERWATVFGFRDDGADWGIVALDNAVGRSPLLEELDASLARATTPFDGPAPPSDVGSAQAPPPQLPLSGPPPPSPPGATTTTRRGAGPPPPTSTTTLPSGITIPTFPVPPP